MSAIHLAVLGGMWHDDTENPGGNMMERKIQKMRHLVAAAVIVLTGAAWTATMSIPT